MDADIIVVGAGQAGCAAAYDLAAAGKKVLWLSKLGGKPCAGGVTVKAEQLLRFSIAPLVRERPLQLDLSLRGNHRVCWPLTSPMCALVKRSELDDLCRRKAQLQGAELISTKRIESVQQRADAVTITAGGACYTAPCVIAADGAHSPLRRLLVGAERAVGAYAIEATLPRKKAAIYPGMQFDFQTVKQGYGWLFPKHDHINVGLYVSHAVGKLPNRDALKTYAQAQLGSDVLEAVQGYPLGTRMPQLLPAAGRVLFAGDAMGSSESLLGEGIYGAILTGQLAAEALLTQTANKAGEAYKASLIEWRREVKWLGRIAWLFYATTPLSYGALHHLLRRSLMQGYAAGFTPLQSMRELRGSRLLETG